MFKKTEKIVSFDMILEISLIIIWRLKTLIFKLIKRNNIYRYPKLKMIKIKGLNNLWNYKKP